MRGVKTGVKQKFLLACGRNPRPHPPARRRPRGHLHFPGRPGQQRQHARVAAGLPARFRRQLDSPARRRIHPAPICNHGTNALLFAVAHAQSLGNRPETFGRRERIQKNALPEFFDPAAQCRTEHLKSRPAFASHEHHPPPPSASCVFPQLFSPQRNQNRQRRMPGSLRAFFIAREKFMDPPAIQLENRLKSGRLLCAQGVAQFVGGEHSPGQRFRKGWKGMENSHDPVLSFAIC